jgi:hypothetical protein
MKITVRDYVDTVYSVYMYGWKIRWWYKLKSATGLHTQVERSGKTDEKYPERI